MTRKRMGELIKEANASIPRDRMFSVRITSTEYARLARAAEAQGLGAATLARVMIVAGLEDLEEGGGQ